LLIAGGTGLAPLLAVLDQVAGRHAARGSGPRVALYHGARHPWGFYAKPELERYADASWLTVTYAVSDDPSFPGRRGLIGDIAAADGPWDDRLAMVCGSPRMVDHTAAVLRRAGFDEHSIRSEKYEDPFTQQPRTTGDPAASPELVQPGIARGIQ
ncbi:oxidoreductase, partial [Microbacterium sp. B35-04]